MAKNKNKNRGSPAEESKDAPAPVKSEVASLPDAVAVGPESSSAGLGEANLQTQLDTALALISSLRLQLAEKDAELVELRSGSSLPSNSTPVPQPPSEDIQKLQVSSSVL